MRYDEILTEDEYIDRLRCEQCNLRNVCDKLPYCVEED